MWSSDPSSNNNNNTMNDDESDVESDSSGEEIPIWVRGEQRWVSGVVGETTCQDIIAVLLRDEEIRGRHVGLTEQYQITERWRGVEQPLDTSASILDIWNAWGTAQPEVKISLRRIKIDNKAPSRRSRCRSDSSSLSDRNAWKTVHPKRLHALQNEKQPSSTEELLRLVLAQGEVIRRQLKKLRHNEHQIGFLEDKTHKARIRKHGSNYLLETYLKGLPEALNPDDEEDRNAITDKNSDSGVVTESSEQSNCKKNQCTTEGALDRFSPSSEDFTKELKDDDASSTISEVTIREQAELFDMIHKINKRLLKEEECLVRLHANLKKYDKEKATTTTNATSDKNNNNNNSELSKTLTTLRTEMAKGACEMQHNEVVLDETKELIDNRRLYMESLHKDLISEEREHEMLQTLMYTHSRHRNKKSYRHSAAAKTNFTKELLDTLV